MSRNTEKGKIFAQKTNNGGEGNERSDEKEAGCHEPVLPRPAEPQQATYRRLVWGVQEYRRPFPHSHQVPRRHPPPDDQQCCICTENMQV